MLTTSFHGTAFSLRFEKPFYTLHLKNGVERIVDLLSKIDLEDRYIKDVTDKQQIETDIYSESVKQNLLNYIDDSKYWLKDSIVKGGGIGV